MGGLMAGLLDDITEYARRSGRNMTGLLDWLGGGAQAGAEPTMALLRGDAIDQPLLPTADSGGRIGAVASAVGSTLMPVAAPTGALGAGPVVRGASAGPKTMKELRSALGKQSSLLKESPPVSEEAATKALTDIRNGVSPYYALTEASGFSMEPAAVAERAEQAGFSPEPLYHGSSSTEITAFNPKKLGSFTGAADADAGVFSTPNPRYAHNYMGKVMEETLDPRLYAQMEAEIEPLWSEWLRSRHTDPQRHAELGQQIEGIRRSYDGRAFNPEYSPGAVYPLRIAPGNVKEIDWRGSNMPMSYRGNRLREAAANGYDSGRYINTGTDDEVIAFQAQQMRSPFAAYNPNWSHRPDLLASGAPASGLLAQPTLDDLKDRL